MQAFQKRISYCHLSDTWKHHCCLFHNDNFHVIVVVFSRYDRVNVYLRVRCSSAPIYPSKKFLCLKLLKKNLLFDNSVFTFQSRCVYTPAMSQPLIHPIISWKKPSDGIWLFMFPSHDPYLQSIRILNNFGLFKTYFERNVNAFKFKIYHHRLPRKNGSILFLRNPSIFANEQIKTRTEALLSFVKTTPSLTTWKTINSRKAPWEMAGI